MLRWWRVLGSYAFALVAAETEERAIELAKADDVRSQWNHRWCVAELEERPMPADPPAEGVYAVFAE